MRRPLVQGQLLLNRRCSDPRGSYLLAGPLLGKIKFLGFLVAILVDAHLAGVDSRVGIADAAVGIEVFCGEGLNVNESFLGARKGLIVGVNVLGGNAWNNALDYLEWTFRGPSYLELKEAIVDPQESSM